MASIVATGEQQVLGYEYFEVKTSAHAAKRCGIAEGIAIS